MYIAAQFTNHEYNKVTDERNLETFFTFELDNKKTTAARPLQGLCNSSPKKTKITVQKDKLFKSKTQSIRKAKFWHPSTA